MHEIDRLERSDHDPELNDLAGVVATDDVDTVHAPALDGGFDFEDGGF